MKYLTIIKIKNAHEIEADDWIFTPKEGSVFGFIGFSYFDEKGRRVYETVRADLLEWIKEIEKI